MTDEKWERSLTPEARDTIKRLEAQGGIIIPLKLRRAEPADLVPPKNGFFLPVVVRYTSGRPSDRHAVAGETVH